MKFSKDLTDLLNSDPQAYEFFYALPPETQNELQSRDIRCMPELKDAAAEVGLSKRPKAF